jgi:serine/threonine protein kinase
MTKNSLENRKKRYFQLSSQIAHLDNAQLLNLFNDNEPSMGWGINHTIELDESLVFVKRVPVTDLEYDHLLSTQNFYNLPTYYNYGIGSAGFGVFRELMAHIKTTHWVMNGTIETFPLMYHYRIMPFSGWRVKLDMEQHQNYVKQWGDNSNIGRYILDRTTANYELVMFLEHVPHVLRTWLKEHPEQFIKPLADLCRTIDFLSKQKIIHFDAHFDNVLTDGDQAYLTDFGLVLDRSFSLTKEEKDFFAQHIFYDYGLVLLNLGNVALAIYDSCPEGDRLKIMEKYGITPDLKPHKIKSILLDNIEPLHLTEMMQISDDYVSAIIKYRSIISLMQNFFTQIQSNQQKNTKFPDAQLQNLLQSAGVISARAY